MTADTMAKPGQARSIHPLIAQAVAFTEAYRRHADAHPAIREAMCLRTLYPAILANLREDDVFAGVSGVSRSRMREPSGGRLIA